MGRSPVRLVLADASALLRSGLRAVLAAEPDLVVVGEAGDGPSAVDLARRLAPDVLVADVGLPRVEALAGGPTRRLFLTDPDPGGLDSGLAALRAGGLGLVAKDLPGPALAAAIRAVVSGQAVVPSAVLPLLLAGISPTPGAAASARSADPTRPTDPMRSPGPRGAARVGANPADLRLTGLTGRERDVLAELARGRSNAEIAGVLGVGEATVKTHVGRVLAKLGARDRVAAVVFAYETGLAHPGD